MAGREPVTVTRYEYDGDGRMIRSVSIPEAEWSPEDVALLVASRQAERELGPHGIPMSEAYDPANQFNFTGKLMTDFAEKARLDTLDAKRKENPDANQNGWVVNVSKKR